jgi:hypothetical protein
MPDGAKALRVVPITPAAANEAVRRWHYSGKFVRNSQLHLGVRYDGRLEGVMQFGPSLDKRKIQGLVADTPWNGFLEVNRLAFSDALPRNSESRAIAVAMRLIRKHYPHVQWVVSFADAAQCGDGTIYRASGFVLTGIRKNTSVWEGPDGDIDDAAAVGRARFSRTSLTDNSSRREQERALAVVRDTRTTATRGAGARRANGAASMRVYRESGFRPLPGFQLRYVYFLAPTARARLTVPVLPFSEIARRGAAMYRGQARAGSIVPDAPAVHAGEGGSVPTPALQAL